MPVILTTPEEIDTWVTAPAEEALKLQRPLADGALQIVARGQKQDGVASEGAASGLLLFPHWGPP
jgi:putative SOS response-associated peptidase YedK